MKPIKPLQPPRRVLTPLRCLNPATLAEGARAAERLEGGTQDDELLKHLYRMVEYTRKYREANPTPETK